MWWSLPVDHLEQKTFFAWVSHCWTLWQPASQTETVCGCPATTINDLNDWKRRGHSGHLVRERTKRSRLKIDGGLCCCSVFLHCCTAPLIQLCQLWSGALLCCLTELKGSLGATLVSFSVLQEHQRAPASRRWSEVTSHLLLVILLASSFLLFTQQNFSNFNCNCFSFSGSPAALLPFYFFCFFFLSVSSTFLSLFLETCSVLPLFKTVFCSTFQFVVAVAVMF